MSHSEVTALLILTYLTHAPKNLSFGIDEIFPIFISFIYNTKTQKTQTNLKVSSGDFYRAIVRGREGLTQRPLIMKVLEHLPGPGS